MNEFHVFFEWPGPGRGKRSHICAVVGVLFGTLAACGGELPPVEDTGAARSGAAAAPPRGAAAAGGESAQLVALGDSIFHGLAGGGTCASCHGQKGAGGPLAPNLADATWLHGDGSTEFIATIVTSGVPKPKQFQVAMPPMGGATLTPDQVRAVAAYVASLNPRAG